MAFNIVLSMSLVVGVFTLLFFLGGLEVLTLGYFPSLSLWRLKTTLWWREKVKAIFPKWLYGFFEGIFLFLSFLSSFTIFIFYMVYVPLLWCFVQFSALFTFLWACIEYGPKKAYNSRVARLRAFYVTKKGKEKEVVFPPLNPYMNFLLVFAPGTIRLREGQWVRGKSFLQGIQDYVSSDPQWVWKKILLGYNEGTDVFFDATDDLYSSPNEGPSAKEIVKRQKTLFSSLRELQFWSKSSDRKAASIEERLSFIETNAAEDSSSDEEEDPVEGPGLERAAKTSSSVVQEGVDEEEN